MPFPIEDTGFKLWHGDLDTQLKRLHGFTSRELGLELRALQAAYYAGTNVANILEQIIVGPKAATA